jgi:hypothetical protein
MNRASPTDLRKCAQLANTYLKAGILFVPMPVLNAADHVGLASQANQRLEQLAQEAEAQES